MSIRQFFWNVRGINDAAKHAPFVNWLNSQRPLFGALLETHIKEPNLINIMSRICHGWSFFSNHQSDDDGRIIVIWKAPAVIRVISQSSQSLSCEVSIPTMGTFIFTAVYASNTDADRNDLWAELLSLHQSLQLDNIPWILGGDFNQILHPADHSSGSVSSFSQPIINFRDTLLQLGVFDLRFHGSYFSWSNKQPTGPIATKIDRLLVNCAWISSFPNSFSSFLAPDISDHCPCITDLSVELPKAGTKPFKFWNYLVKHPNFVEIVKEAWVSSGAPALDLRTLSWKLKSIKKDLKLLNKENYSNIQERVTNAHQLLQTVQLQALASPSPGLFLQERNLHARWMFQVRRSSNTIHSFTLSSGEVISDAIAICAHAIKYFKGILSPSVREPGFASLSWLQSLLRFRCSGLQKALLSSHPTPDQIKRVLFRLNPNKAPGPDGLTSGFFRGAWDFLGSEVVNSISQFFVSGFLPTTCNSTILTLVPKRIGATMISDYRPISCLNTTYKVISRLLVARLKLILPELILPNQTAFIKKQIIAGKYGSGK